MRALGDLAVSGPGLCPTETLEPVVEPNPGGGGGPDDGPRRGLACGRQLGRYVLLDRVGEGGMGVVYAAFDRELERKVAVKLLRPGRRSRTRQAHARLMREAKAMARVDHPNVVGVYDIALLDERLLLAMEFVEGTTLTRYLARERPPWPVIVDAFLQAGRGLAAAHAAGVVHRDFKPDNVLRGVDGRIRVTDFGLARPLEMASGEPRGMVRSMGELTDPGVVLGTPPYMAPEHVNGLPADPRSDQFSYCVALYEALYGQRPFAGLQRSALMAEIARGRIRKVPRGSSVPQWVHRIVVRGLAADPNRRWPSMAALVARLERGPRWHRLAWPLGAVAVLGCGGLAVAMQADTAACDDDGPALQWTAAHRAAARDAFLRGGRGHGADVWARVEASLDRYVSSGLGVARTACTSEGPLSIAYTGCLERSGQRFRALTALVQRSDPAIIDGAIDLAASIPSPDVCLRATELTTTPPADGDPVETVSILERLYELRARTHSAGSRRDLDEARALEDRVRRLGATWLLAEVRLTLGDLEARTGDEAAARSTWIAAFESVEVVDGPDLPSAELVARLVRTAPAAADAAHWRDRWVARFGSDGLETPEFLRAWAHRLRREGSLAPAVDVLWHAGEVDGRHGADHPRAIATWLEAADLSAEVGRRDEVADAIARAVRAAERVYGTRHPRTVEVLAAASELSERIDDSELARRYGDKMRLALAANVW